MTQQPGVRRDGRRDRRYQPDERRRDCALTIRLTSAELDDITQRAEACGLSVSEYVRRQAMRGMA